MNEENSKVTPQEVKGWSWGAFMFSWIWGFGNKSYLTFFTLIPIFGFIWRFVCGFKGNDWAWKKGNYSSVDEFKKVQSTWNRAGLFLFILAIALSVIINIAIRFILIPDLLNM
ncbi:hypothetical protein [Weissella koreensis]|uniref:Uncharacterized protein n=1 Tax=Weissella koreensis TaxID=165096 RepID=A0A7H1MKG7_9LACO|nr:hypothetical protein [Weissella koreensis]AVH74696.1 hypothetical protein C4597_01090 [Weissella koreensis]EJF33653.1 hypothetical protein JC2156_04670 [Weissella koreensis KCTC 3621]EJF34055.1 hypothetical protein JC2156_03630 [Weissella koreensis KCTC 3621]QGN19919.1 hypothetical protein GKC51_01060 [Weissella koreensis]QNT63953.1 hypothetical protein FY536_01095 [Weissella koreensis]